MGADRYAFLVEYFDQNAALVRQYQLLYYLTDNTIEMHDFRNRRIFLKRCEYPTITPAMLFIGSVINVYSRQLTIVDYADDFTKAQLEVQSEKTLAIIKPDAMSKMGKILDATFSEGFRVCNLRSVRMDRCQAEEFYGSSRGQPGFSELVQFITSDYVLVMELVADNAIGKWRKLVGPASTFDARQEAPKSLRAQFGTDAVRNATHGSDSREIARKEVSFFFENQRRFRPTAFFNNCTLCIIKPHAVASGVAGQIIDAILGEGFEISALQMFILARPNAEEFLEVYKGVVPEYLGMVDELTAGPCIAMEVRAEAAVESFRQLCGPIDPEVCQLLRPDTLRAHFGVDRVRNAVHCTDLPEDGVLEVEYFFKILQTYAT